MPEDTPAFPGVSLVYPAINDPEKWPFPPESKGAIRPDFVQYTGAVAPKGLFSGHYCGTLRDHEQGGLYAGDVVPVAESGWPVCCAPPFVLRGGGGSGFGAGIEIISGVDPSSDCHTAPLLALDVPTVVRFPASGGPYWIGATPGVVPSVASMRITAFSGTATFGAFQYFPDVCTPQTGSSNLSGVGCVNVVFTGSGGGVGAVITPGGVAGQATVTFSNSAC